MRKAEEECNAKLKGKEDELYKASVKQEKAKGLFMNQKNQLNLAKDLKKKMGDIDCSGFEDDLERARCLLVVGDIFTVIGAYVEIPPPTCI